jgi:hypothetical protein
MQTGKVLFFTARIPLPRSYSLHDGPALDEGADRTGAVNTLPR